MSPAPGTRLGPYEILAPIGAGGMGEVYRARDTKLKRDVAVKVLPEAFARDPDRMVRFQREAEVLASLNHPNIAQIYGVEGSALIMELVEGETLKGPLPLETALNYAKQIADALEAAHEKNIVHRDLKPANVMITPTGMVKVLDFGLATVLQGSTPTTGDATNSPTLTMRATQAGVIMGTAAYMSPEQARGKLVDKRADIWAFGVLLYELLTGKQAFSGETITDVLAAVVKEEPDLTRVPAVARRLVLRCLEKEPQRRLRDIGDAMILVDEDIPVGTERPQLRLWTIASGVLAIVAVIALWAPWRKPAAPENRSFQIVPPVSTGVAFALSPDGSKMAFVAHGPDGIERLWVRLVNSLDVRSLPGSEIDGPVVPFWSPDSRWIAFATGGQLKKINISGGPAQVLCKLDGTVVGGSWNQDGMIIFGKIPGGIMRVAERGGNPSTVILLGPSQEAVFPTFLPDGRHFLYEAVPTNDILIGTVDAQPGQQSSKHLLEGTLQATYVPPTDAGLGHLLYFRQGALLTQSFDAQRLELSGEPVLVAEHVGAQLAFGFFSASANGVLAYRPAAQDFQLTWLDRQGNAAGRVGEPGRYNDVAISPDGTHAAVTLVNSHNTFNADLWLFDFMHNTRDRFTFGPLMSAHPVWSPNGSRIAFLSINGSAGTVASSWTVRQKLVGGPTQEEVLLPARLDLIPTSWSRNGHFLLYTLADQKTKNDLWALPMEGDRKPQRQLGTEFNESDGRFSPDGHWIAYVSDESGRSEVYVRTFPDSGNRWLLSRGGGSTPRWPAQSKELFYVAPDGKMMAVEIGDTPARASAPRELFRAPPGSGAWDVTPNGKRFLFALPAEEGSQAPFVVVLNWTTGLKNKADSRLEN